MQKNTSCSFKLTWIYKFFITRNELQNVQKKLQKKQFDFPLPTSFLEDALPYYRSRAYTSISVPTTTIFEAVLLIQNSQVHT